MLGGVPVGVIVFNLTTAALLIVMFRCGVLTVGEDTIRRRPVPWVAVALTVAAVVGVLVQVVWSGAFAALANDPAKTGWWRPATAVFLQNNVSGAVWNLVTLAAIASLAEWVWGWALMVGFFCVGALVPSHLDPWLGVHGVSHDPRNFVGSSGATYFLAATMAGALVIIDQRRRHEHRRGTARGGVRPVGVYTVLGLVVPVMGLVMWVAQANGHGLVSVEGFVLGVIVACVVRPVPQTRVRAPKTAGPAEAQRDPAALN